MALDLEGESLLLSRIKFGNGQNEKWRDVSYGVFGNSLGRGDKVAGRDIADMLPRDPFDMDLSATFTITGWIEDFELENLGFESCSEEFEDGEGEGEESEDGEGEGKGEVEDDHLLAEVFVWNSVHTDFGARKTCKKSSISPMEVEKEKGFDEDDHLCLDSSIEAFMGFSYEKYWNPKETVRKPEGWTEKDNTVGVPGPPSDALLYALGYLGMGDLFSVERVCKSLREAVQNDPLLWRNFRVPCHLSGKITDDTLLRLTSRAQGILSSLSIMECSKITDLGLRRVLKLNPGLTKLSTAGCRKLTIEGTLQSLRIFKSISKPGIKQFRIGQPFGLNSHHFEEFKLLFGAENISRVEKPRFYRAGQFYLSLDDERVFDIESCPRCHHFRQVYDCPTENCRGKQNTSQACRACMICIPRCKACGCCLNNRDYEETFFLDCLCMDCFKLAINCPDRQNILPSYVHQQASYHFLFYG